MSITIGDYCDVADVVLEMRDYKCYDITEEARKVVEDNGLQDVITCVLLSLLG